MSVHLNILCLIYINLLWKLIMLSWQERMDLTQFSFIIQWNNNNHYHTRLVQMKFDMGTLCLDNHHQSFGSWLITGFNMSWITWANSRLARVSLGLKFCDDTVCCNALTPNNPQNLYPDYLVAGFWVQWTRAHGSGGKEQWCHNDAAAFAKNI